MKYYVVAMSKVYDLAWTEEYTEKVTAMVEELGGRYVVRTTQFAKLEGSNDYPEVFVIIEFPSKEIAETFYHSDAYRPYRDARHTGADTEFYLMPVMDEAKE